MADIINPNVADEITFEYEWDIECPFLPFHRLETSFTEGTASGSSKWMVRLEPTILKLKDRGYAFCLEFDRVYAKRNQILVKNVAVEFCLIKKTIDKTEKETIKKIEIQNYVFNERNRYTYCSDLLVDIFHTTSDPSLIVYIKISLPRKDAEDQYEINEDLSTDLKEMSFAIYPNMLVCPKSCGLEYVEQVHTYMIFFRWNNFFEINNYDTTNDHYPVDMSSRLFKHLLKYVYNGKLNVINSWVTDEVYFAELSQVIDQYSLNHLHEHFLGSFSKVKQFDTKFVLRKSTTFTVNIVEGKPQVGLLHRGHWCLRQEDVVDFEVRAKYVAGIGTWLYYLMETTAQGRYYVNVKWEMCDEPKPDTEKITEPGPFLHEFDNILEPNKCVNTYTYLMLNYAHKVNELILMTHNEAIKDKYSIRFVAHFTDGIYVTQIQNTYNPPPRRDKMLEVLSDDMYKLLHAEYATDFKVSPLGDTGPLQEYKIHKEIFNCRLQRWRQVLENADYESCIPDEARFTLEPECMRYVIEYIYTGKSREPIPNHLLDRIRDFARRGGCNFLANV